MGEAASLGQEFFFAAGTENEAIDQAMTALAVLLVGLVMDRKETTDDPA